MSVENKKISFFIGSMRRGGAERVISILANYYCKKGWDVEIVLLLDCNIGYELEKNIRVIDLSGRNSSYLINLPVWMIKIRKYLKKRKPGRVVSFVGRINMLVLTAGVGMKLPMIVSERNDPKHDGRGKIMQWYCNRVYKKADMVVFQTRYEQTCFSEKLKSMIIPNPVGVREKWKQNDGFLIVTAGRLEQQKNHMLLIEAIHKLKENFPDVKLKIFGDGSLKSELLRKVKELGLENYVCLCGNVKNLHKCISSAAMFVLTSDYEGLSNALIEAMMMGLPCISTAYPGADEIISSGINGLLVPCGDVEALADAIEKIITDKEFGKELSKYALASACKYQSERVLTQWEYAIEGESRDVKNER